jgi:hypothetical protein
MDTFAQTSTSFNYSPQSVDSQDTRGRRVVRPSQEDGDPAQHSIEPSPAPSSHSSNRSSRRSRKSSISTDPDEPLSPDSDEEVTITLSNPAQVLLRPAKKKIRTEEQEEGPMDLGT